VARLKITQTRSEIGSKDNQRQIETSGMLDRSERRIRSEEIPAIVERGRHADVMRQNALNSGCPEGGGEVPIATANRCNPLVQAHRAEVERIEADVASIKQRLSTISAGREAVSQSTLANAQKQKENNARRQELDASQLQLQSQMAIRALAVAGNRGKATKACKAIKENEEAHCCLSVVSDGANPARCGVKLIYRVFLDAGLFGTAAVVPQ